MFEIRLMGSYKRIKEFSDIILYPVTVKNNDKGYLECRAYIKLNERETALLLKKVKHFVDSQQNG